MNNYPNLTTPATQQLFERFSKEKNVDLEAYNYMVEIVNLSPTLHQMLNEAASSNGYLKSMGMLPSDSTWGGMYYSGTQRIEFNYGTYFNFAKPSNLTEEQRKLGLIGIAVHELHHGVDKNFDAEGKNQTNQVIVNLAKTRQPEIDYTPAVETYFGYKAKGEALAEMAAWNAAVEYLQNKNGHVDLKSMGENYPRANAYMAQDSVSKTFYVKDDFSFIHNLPNLKVDPNNPEHVKGFEQNYFVHGARNVGHGTSDYPNTYATEVLQAIHFQHQFIAGPSSKIMLDMKALGLSEQEIEMNGVNVGGAGNKMVYYDIHSPDVPRYFDDSINPTNIKSQAVNHHLRQYNDNNNLDVNPLSPVPTVPKSDVIEHFQDEVGRTKDSDRLVGSVENSRLAVQTIGPSPFPTAPISEPSNSGASKSEASGSETSSAEASASDSSASDSSGSETSTSQAQKPQTLRRTIAQPPQPTHTETPEDVSPKRSVVPQSSVPQASVSAPSTESTPTQIPTQMPTPAPETEQQTSIGIPHYPEMNAMILASHPNVSQQHLDNIACRVLECCPTDWSTRFIALVPGNPDRGGSFKEKEGDIGLYLSYYVPGRQSLFIPHVINMTDDCMKPAHETLERVQLKIQTELEQDQQRLAQQNNNINKGLSH